MDVICKADFDLRMKAYNQAREANERNLKAKITVPEIGYYDIYDVRFHGEITRFIKQISQDRFTTDPGKMMHVYVDMPPKKIAEGIHEITCYDRACRLYKWLAQGYHRGLVVLADDKIGNAGAAIYMNSGTWSWLLSAEETARLANLNNDHSQETLPKEGA